MGYCDVRLNLPGQVDYSPCLPWVSKIRLEDNCIACDVVVFVDGLRVTGHIDEEVWEAAQQAGATVNHLGIQDAASHASRPLGRVSFTDRFRWRSYLCWCLKKNGIRPRRK
jgi:hypothetical protein